MNFIDDALPLELPLVETSIRKVIGVGGGGGNAVNHMYRQGIKDVSFVVCNTDNQALAKSPVPIRIQLGIDRTAGLGAGGDPIVARQAAEESIERIQAIFEDNTKMVFITAGMGGGTGTGASPVVAQAAHDLGILTVGIVTIPFAFEGKLKIKQAHDGISELKKHVDAILVIDNEKLKEIYPDLELANAFAKADDVLTSAAKGIAEIITVPGYINTDFADVYSIMKDGKVAIMNTGFASGENRITKAIENALNSPLLYTADVKGASKVLLSLYCSTTNQIKMEEVQQIHDFMNKVGDNVQVIWGATYDDKLEDNVKITIIETGYSESDIRGMSRSADNGNNKAKVNQISSALENEPEVFEISEFETISKEDKLNRTFDQYYKNEVPKTENQPEVSVPNKNEKMLQEISLDDLEDDSTLKRVENIPAWKRRFMK
jgi:cell division protein FtsZ